MRRDVKKQFWMTREEDLDLKKKAKRTCMTEAALIRLLIRGYEPRDRPDDRFFQTMEQVTIVSNQMEELARAVRAKDGEVSEMLKQEAWEWKKFRAQIEAEYLRPEKRMRKWQ